MRDINETISAISSASLAQSVPGKSILRISGPSASGIIESIFRNDLSVGNRSVIHGSIEIEDGFCTSANVYFFKSPRSYTGQDLAEIHTFASESVVRQILTKILLQSRMAEAGEFTLRAYLNGKIDLSQAEAVAAIVSGSNNFQLSAAEKLLDGSLASRIAEVRESILELLSLIEVGLDFSQEDIEFVTSTQAAEQIALLQEQLGEILAGSIRYEEMIDLMSVGLAGDANVGKSSLVNMLLASKRSIVTDEHGTTRDVLTGILELKNARCAIFDCAGLGYGGEKLLESLANQAAVDSLKNADIVILCIDAKAVDHLETKKLIKSIDPKKLICIMTRCDLLEQKEVSAKQEEIEKVFAADCIATSSLTGSGIDELKDMIERQVVSLSENSAQASERIAINQRHRQVIEMAIKNLDQAKDTIKQGTDEVATMLLRTVYQSLGSVEREQVDEAVLDRIFSNFCIGK